MMELWKLEIFYSALSFSFLANNNVIKDERYLALLSLLVFFARFNTKSANIKNYFHISALDI